ncbi:hypothetical protein [Clostridium sp. UBA1056]|uniref:hypothetical protein n=1 Tax=unclassified Clostridium TaxID=2614128 RepID=UPI003216A6A0
MIEIVYFKEEKLIQKLQLEIQASIRKILKILDDEYGEGRNKYEDDGGYVVVIEKKEDFKELEDKAYIECNEVIAEYVDKIVCNNGEVYTNSLIICNNNYAITLIIPMELTPQNLKDYMID